MLCRNPTSTHGPKVRTLEEKGIYFILDGGDATSRESIESCYFEKDHGAKMTASRRRPIVNLIVYHEYQGTVAIELNSQTYGSVSQDVLAPCKVYSPCTTLVQLIHVRDQLAVLDAESKGAA
jgi:hypothetical protein